jgi:hypothetical protein
MTRYELLMDVFKRHLRVTYESKKNPIKIKLKPFALDECWYTAFPKAENSAKNELKK